tara:strand:- start:692 stop:994 length:303 start_codon:yes stop_codon:yes gene_type:complete
LGIPTLDVKTFKSKKSRKVDHSQAFIARALLGHYVPGFKVCVPDKWLENAEEDIQICTEMQSLADEEESYMRGTIGTLLCQTMRCDREGPVTYTRGGPLD